MSGGPYMACITSKDEQPQVYDVLGPGAGPGYRAWVMYPENTLPDMAAAERTARMMNIAYEEGRRALRREIASLLGVG